MEKKKSYCILCGEEKKGIEIREDHVISAIKWFNRNVRKSVKNNVLVVCSSCYPKYKEYRGKFVKRRGLYVAFGALFLVFTLILAFTPYTLLIGILMILFLYLLSLLSYMPALNLQSSANKGKFKEAATPDKRSK